MASKMALEEKVIPTYAGVILVFLMLMSLTFRNPHIRGGDSKQELQKYRKFE